MSQTSRRCPVCGTAKLMTEEYWYARKGSPTGFQSWCKKCQQDSGKQYKRRRNRALLRLDTIKAVAVRGLAASEYPTGALLEILELADINIPYPGTAKED